MSRASRTFSFGTTSATARRRRRPPVWFRSIYLKTVRGFRVPIFGWGVGLGVLMAAVLAAVPTLLNTAAARAAVVALGSSFAFIAEPIKIDTPGGYATWKYGLTILVVCIWPILASTGMIRGVDRIRPQPLPDLRRLRGHRTAGLTVHAGAAYRGRHHVGPAADLHGHGRDASRRAEHHLAEPA